MSGVREWGKRGMGSQCLKGIEVQFRKVKKSQRRMTVSVAEQGECT